MIGPLEPRVAVLESKVSDLETEESRTRSRLHDLESDRAAIRYLAEKIKELADNTERIATSAASKAVAAALRDRDEQVDQQHSRRIGAAGVFVMGATVLVNHFWR